MQGAGLTNGSILGFIVFPRDPLYLLSHSRPCAVIFLHSFLLYAVHTHFPHTLPSPISWRTRALCFWPHNWIWDPLVIQMESLLKSTKTISHQASKTKPSVFNTKEEHCHTQLASLCLCCGLKAKYGFVWPSAGDPLNCISFEKPCTEDAHCGISFDSQDVSHCLTVCWSTRNYLIVINHKPISGFHSSVFNKSLLSPYPVQGLGGTNPSLVGRETRCNQNRPPENICMHTNIFTCMEKDYQWKNRRLLMVSWVEFSCVLFYYDKPVEYTTPIRCCLAVQMNTLLLTCCWFWSNIFRLSILQSEAAGHRVHEETSWQSQRHPSYCKSRHSDPRGVPAF